MRAKNYAGVSIIISAKGWIVNMFDFAGCRVSVETPQLCRCGAKWTQARRGSQISPGHGLRAPKSSQEIRDLPTQEASAEIIQVRENKHYSRVSKRGFAHILFHLILKRGLLYKEDILLCLFYWGD